MMMKADGTPGCVCSSPNINNLFQTIPPDTRSTGWGGGGGEGRGDDVIKRPGPVDYIIKKCYRGGGGSAHGVCVCVRVNY